MHPSTFLWGGCSHLSRIGPQSPFHDLQTLHSSLQFLFCTYLPPSSTLAHLLLPLWLSYCSSNTCLQSSEMPLVPIEDCPHRVLLRKTPIVSASMSLSLAESLELLGIIKLQGLSPTFLDLNKPMANLCHLHGSDCLWLPFYQLDCITVGKKLTC